MKKTKLALSILCVASMLYGCSKKEIIEEIPKLKNSGRVAYNGDGLWDVLGFGYDCTGAALHIDSVSDSQIIDMERFNKEQPNMIAPQNGGISNTRMYSGSNYFEYLKDAKREIGGKIEVTPSTDGDEKTIFNANFTKNSNKSYFFSSKYSFSTFESIKRVKRLKFKDELSKDVLIQYLTPSFLNHLQNLSADNLVRIYGTHLLTDITLGGRLIVNHRASVVKEDSESMKKTSIGAGVAGAVFKAFGLTASGTYTTEEKNKALTENSNREFQVEFQGGNTSGYSVTIDANANVSQSVNIGTWEQSITVNNCVLVDIGGSIPLYDLVTDPIKKALVKAAVEKRIADRQIEVLQVSPLYRVFSAGDKNQMNVTTMAEVNNLVNNYGNQFQGLVGYIARNSAPGRIPLHSMKSLGDKNNFFLTSQSDVDQHVQRWKNIHYGIVGYSMPNGPEMLPLLGVHSDGDKNTMYFTHQSEVDYLVNTWGNRYLGNYGYIIAP